MININETVLARMRPLFWYQGELFLSQSCHVHALGHDGQLRHIFSFPDTRTNRWLDRSKLLYRLRRSGVYSAISDEEFAYLSYRSCLYQWHHSTRQLTHELQFERGNGPLQFGEIKDLAGFSDAVIFGEYFGNSDKGPIRVFRKRKRHAWEVAHTFPARSLNHIHHLVPDSIRQCVWILGGDFGEAASLWQAHDDFSSVELVVGGEQKYRACVAFPVDQGLLYATDTQFEPNSIRLLERQADGWRSREIAGLNGPCIYGCETDDYFVFSTATEPSKDVRNKYLALLDNRAGPGIYENRSDIVVCRKSDFSCRLLASRAKDWWPYRLFQFGSITFPNGKNPSNTIYAFNIGSKQNDLATEAWPL